MKLEIERNEVIEKKPETFHQQLKLDKHGIPLVPQPSDHEDDPLNWPYWKKVYIAILVAVLGFSAQLTSALPNPSFVQMAQDLGVMVEQASYTTTVWILFSGICPMFLVPFANVYGRRPLYVIFTVIAWASSIGSASASSYGGVITGRIFNGIGSSIALGFGAAAICDLFNQGERGLYLGIYTVSVTNGPHVAPIIGGFITERMSWRWCLWIPSVLQGLLWILLFLTFPETLFSREDHSKLEKQTYVQRLFFHSKVLDRPLHARDFGTAFRMIRYAAVALPCVFYMTNNTYGSTIFAVTGAHICASVYHFPSGQTGLFMGVPLTIGCIIGECMTGWVSDQIITAYAKRHGGHRKPEVRLWLVGFVPLLAVGTATYGYCIEHEKPWIAAAVCMAVSGLGSQVGTTVVYTYTTDSYKSQSGEIGAVIHLIKSVYAFNVGFYALPFSERAGYDVTFGILAMVNFVTLLPLGILICWGQRIREVQGVPHEHEDI